MTDALSENDKMLADLGIVLQSTSTIEPFFNMVIYGESGNGKTLLLSTLPEPILFLDFESGTLTLRELNLDMLKITSRKQLGGVIKVLTSKQLTSKIHKGQPFRSVVVDSVTEFQQMVMDEVTGIDGVEESQVTLQHWGKILASMSKLTRTLRDLEYNTGFSALSKKNMNVNGQHYPTLKGSFMDDFPGYFDFVLYLGILYRDIPKTNSIGEVLKDEDGVVLTKVHSQRYLACESEPENFAKNRGGKLSKREYETREVKLNLTDLMKKVYAEEVVETTATEVVEQPQETPEETQEVKKTENA